MSLASRVGTAVAPSSGNATGAYPSGAASSADHGHIAWVKRLANTAPVVNSTGWTLKSSTTSGTMWQGLYYKRGDGITNNFVVQTGSVNTAVLIVEYAGVYTDDFIANVVWANSAGANVATLTSPSISATEDGMVAVAMVGMNSTMTGAAHAGYIVPSISAGTTLNVAEKALPTTGTSATDVATWTTARNAILGVATLKVTEPPGQMSYFEWTGDGTLNHPLNLLGTWEA